MSIFIQLHGFTKVGSDPDVIMSNGVQNDQPPIDYLDALRTNLLSEDASLTFKIAHLDLAWDRLLGTTNTQGRFINGSGDPCETSAVDNTGRFLHLEQAKPKLREFSMDWPKMANAIAATFTLQSLPVELVSFEGDTSEDGVMLNWETATEVNNYGFEIERNTSLLFPSQEGKDWSKIGFVHGYGTTNSPKKYSFTDTDLPDANEADYRLKQIDNDGAFTYSKTVTVDLPNITSVKDKVKYEFSVEQNYPNPFNPTTTITFTIPFVGNAYYASITKLIVYDILGKEVATLVNQKLLPGNHSVTFDASNLSSGMYFYKLKVGEKYNSVKKMMLIK